MINLFINLINKQYCQVDAIGDVALTWNTLILLRQFPLQIVSRCVRVWVTFFV